MDIGIALGIGGERGGDFRGIGWIANSFVAASGDRLLMMVNPTPFTTRCCDN